MKILKSRSKQSSAYYIPSSPLFLACLILPPWRWRQHAPPKRQLTFNGLHGVKKIILCSISLHYVYIYIMIIKYKRSNFGPTHSSNTGWLYLLREVTFTTFDISTKRRKKFVPSVQCFCYCVYSVKTYSWSLCSGTGERSGPDLIWCITQHSLRETQWNGGGGGGCQHFRTRLTATFVLFQT
jgi:hypothetical protein